jgi:predicted protein tyrosine phosphatase
MFAGCGSGFEFKGKNIEMDYFPVHEAEHIEPNDNMALISIGDPEYQNKIDYSLWKHKLVLAFHDIDQPVNGYTMFDEFYAKKLIEFVLVLPDDINKIVVHCYAGISRSGATVRFLQKHIYPSCFNEDFWMKYMIYNRHIYSVLEKIWIRDYALYNKRSDK